MLPDRLSPRRVVITGLGLVSPLGNSPPTFWSALATGQSGVVPCEKSSVVETPLKFAGEAREFSGKIDNFGPLPADRKKWSIPLRWLFFLTSCHQAHPEAHGSKNARFSPIFFQARAHMCKRLQNTPKITNASFDIISTQRTNPDFHTTPPIQTYES